MSDTTKGYIAAILATLIIGFSFLFVKVSLINGNPLDILAHRFTLAFLAIIPFAISKRQDLHFTKATLIKSLPIVILYPLLLFSLQIYGLSSQVSSSEAGIIQAISPVFIMILAIFFLNETITILQWLCTGVSVFGVLLIFVMQGATINPNHYFGLLLVLASVLAMAVYSILMRKNKPYFTVFQITFLCTTVGFIVFNVFSAIQHIMHPAMPSALSPFANSQYVAAILYLGVLSSLGTSFFTSYSYAKVEASKLGVFGNLVIVVTIFAGVVFLDETITSIHIAGATLIFFGVLGTNLLSKKS